MAECSFVRCVQERRAIKKELQRWTKNMVFVVGLERVAEELMGRRKWKKYQDLVSCQTSTVDEVKDWAPLDKCCLCDEKTFLDRAPSPASDQGSSSDESIYCDSPPVTSLPDTPPLEKPREAMTTFESFKLAAIAALNRSPDVAPNMFCPPGPGGLFAPWYLPPTLPPHLGPRPLPMEAPPGPKLEVNGPEQPLDLSAKAVPRSPTIMPASPQSLRVPGMDNKHIFKAKPRMSAVAGRRTYTEDELQAALRDIQSGKLGTRRAAVIYGIPRSTLRNKVYKLAMERERDAQLLLNAPSRSVVDILPGDEDDKELSAAEEEREVEKALRQPLLSMDDLARFSVLEGVGNPDALRHALQRGGDVWGGLEHSALGPYVSQLLAAGKEHPHGDALLPKFPSPLLPELVRRMMVEEKLMMKHRRTPPVNGEGGGPSPSSQREEETTSDAEAAPSNVILKIPSFKPTSSMGASPNVSEPFPSPSHESSSQPFNGGADSRSPPSLLGKGIGIHLRDVIANSIGQKFHQGGTEIPLTQKLLMSPDVEPPYKRGRFSPPPPPAAKYNNNNNHHVDDRNKMSGVPKQPSGGASASSVGGKGTRPKRGKYRNYDRDSLVEAVRAVQRGEMSVHRAGSYYGVPHSTLEYKVKERHLMRPRKRDPKPPAEELKRAEDARLRHDKPKLGPPKPMKPPYPTSPLQNPPNGLKIPPMFDPAMSPLAYSTPPPFPFWPPNPFHSLPMPEFPRGPNAHEHFLASQMMQRLQEESSRVPGVPVSGPPAPPPPVPLGKNAREMAESLYDGTGTNGTFLDGIIRSSLEMGLPSSDAGKEGAPENLSNKSLLDQLCRNSRLTPPPPSDSSEDEDPGRGRGGDYSPSSEDSGRRTTKHKESTDGDDYYAKSSKDRFSDNDSRSKDSVEEFSEKEEREDDDESACDSKNILQKPVEVAAKDNVQEQAENVEETEQQTTDTKSEIDT